MFFSFLDFYRACAWSFRWRLLDLSSPYIVSGEFSLLSRLKVKVLAFMHPFDTGNERKWLSREGDLECRQSRTEMVRGIVLRPRSPVGGTERCLTIEREEEGKPENRLRNN